MTRHINSIPLFNVKHGYFKISFFPSTIIEWNNLDSNIKNSESLALLRKRLLTFIKPSANSTFHCHGSNGVNYIKFHICNCGSVETTIHYLLHCPNFSKERLTLFNKLKSIDENILSTDDSNISKVLLFGDDSFDDVKNTSVLTASIKYIFSTKRYDAPLYQN